MKKLFLVSVLGLLCACTESEPTSEQLPPDEQQGDFVEAQGGKADANGVEEASYEGICVLNYVNRADEGAILDAVHDWPGEAIIKARRGADGAFGTADDVTFETLEQLDDVDWVGRITFGQLKRSAQESGFCVGIAEEYLIPGEEDAFFTIADRAVEEVEKKAAENGIAHRDAHAKAHGCVQASLKVEEGLAPEYRVGVFAQERTYPAWVRLSNGAFAIQSDLVKDVRGFAVKVMDVPGKKVLEHKQDARTQDFLFINSPTMFVRTPEDYIEFASKTFDGNPVSFFLSLDPREWKIRELTNLLGAVTQEPMNPLRSRYWSTTPYAWGEGAAVKYSVIPCDGETLDGRLGDEGESYLRDAMQVHLSQTDACFEFLVQRQVDPEHMPVEDATLEWSEELSPFVKVATLTVPMQDFATPEQDALCEDLAFNPWHTLSEHKPLGNINRARRVVYDMVSTYRRTFNEAKMDEPDGFEL